MTGEILWDLARALEEYSPDCSREDADRHRILHFTRTRPRPFDRAHLDAHLTASAMVIDAGGERLLLGFHRKLRRWLQVGGHGEPGETSPLDVALREAEEESGISGLVLFPSAPAPFDLDVHRIPARKNIPEHLHLDIRYLLVAPAGASPVHRDDEHLGMKWWTWKEAAALELDDSIHRMLMKARRLLDGTRHPADAD